MTQDMQQLVADAVQLTGAAPPSLLDENAPVLASDELSPPQSDPLYFIGLIGGKDVGKSSLVNALVGRDISARTSFGPGTQDVIAYAHGARREEVRALLEAEVPARFRIVTHDNASLDRQVLLDLPDIDSHWSDHVQITRRILRHMLYPLWIASIEKYADQRPQKLLAEVAAGNDPRNFLFCLNKVDQLPAPDAGALRDDYARRIAGTLKLSEPPVVRLISALAPGAHDLPALRALLASQKAEESVTDARDLANRRRQRTLVAWLDAQNLPQRQAQARRLLDTAEELLADRVAQPILEQRLPRLQSDAGFRAWLLEPALNSRMSRWPIVNLIHGALSPLAALVRTNTGTTAGGSAALLHAYVNENPAPAALLQPAFAHLRQTDPALATLYRTRRLWDDAPADAAGTELSVRLIASLEAQRQTLSDSMSSKLTLIWSPLRWLLTIGALLWFPLVQPILETALNVSGKLSVRDIARLIVPLIGATYLLKSVAFLCIYFVVLWLIVRWDTQRRAARFIKRSSSGLTAATLEWVDELSAPIREHCQRVESLCSQLDQARKNSAA